MKNKTVYDKTYPLQLNVFLIFYIYVFSTLVIANLLPVSVVTYFLFLIFGIIGICLLLVRYKCHILIKENRIFLSIKIPLKMVLLKLEINEIKTVEQIDVDPLVSSGYGIKKLQRHHTSYLFKKGKCLKLTMRDGKIFTVSWPDSDNLITRINALKDNRDSKI